MNQGHRGHLYSSLLALEEMSRQMERVARDGRSPTSGQALTPLDESEWGLLAGCLDRMEGQLQEAIRQLAPEGLAERCAVENRSVTLYWLSVLLRQLEEEIVDDLDPARTQRKFGELAGQESGTLTELAQNMRAAVSRMRCYLDGLRSSRGDKSP